MPCAFEDWQEAPGIAPSKLQQGSAAVIWNLFKPRKSRSAPQQAHPAPAASAPPADQPENPHRFTPDLLAAAKAGDADAQYRLGMAFYEGIGIERHSIRAFNWWLSAATHEHGRAQAMVAFAFEVGAGVKPNLLEAAYWAMLSEHNGNETGAALLPIILRRLSQDQHRAVLDMYRKGRTHEELIALYPADPRPGRII